MNRNSVDNAGESSWAWMSESKSGVCEMFEHWVTEGGGGRRWGHPGWSYWSNTKRSCGIDLQSVYSAESSACAGFAATLIPLVVLT